MGSHTFYLFAAILGLPGLALLWYEHWVRQNNLRSQSWPATQGRIRQSGVRSHTDSEGNTSYQAVADYEYVVGGTLQRSQRITFGGSYGTHTHCTELIQCYAPGSDVTVYYDPAQPDSAVLDRIPVSGTTSTALVGRVLFALGLVSLLAGLLCSFWPR